MPEARGPQFLWAGFLGLEDHGLSVKSVELDGPKPCRLDRQQRNHHQDSGEPLGCLELPQEVLKHLLVGVERAGLGHLEVYTSVLDPPAGVLTTCPGSDL